MVHLLQPSLELPLSYLNQHYVTVSVMAVNAKVTQYTSQRQTGLLLNSTRTSLTQGSCIEIITTSILLENFDIVDSTPKWQIEMKNMRFLLTRQEINTLR